MNVRIKAHVDGLFAGVANSRHIADVREELLANLNEKYDDLITSGQSEEDAFYNVISGIGDIGQLINTITESPEHNRSIAEKSRTTRGLFISTGASLYVLSLAVFFLLGLLSMPEFGLIALIVICAAATGMVVYGVSQTADYPPRSTDGGETFVSEYIEKTREIDKRKKLRGAVSSSMWTLVTVLYFAVSFMTRMWWITWLMFVAGALAQELIAYLYSLPEKRGKHLHACLWLLTLIIYFIISFGFNIWAYSWIIFLVAASAGQIVRMMMLWKDVSGKGDECD